MEIRKEDVVNTVASWSFEEKKNFFKSFLSTLTPKETCSIRNIAPRGKRRVDRRKLSSEDEHTPKSEQPSSGEVPVAPQKWWHHFKPSEVLGFDCEMVTIEREGCNQQVGAIVAVCDLHGTEIYKAKIKRSPGSFKVNKKTLEINGIQEDDLMDGFEFEQVQEKLQNLFDKKLIIGHAVAKDFESMSMDSGDYDTFDLQWHWWRVDQCNGSRLEFKLKALHKHFFPEEKFQEGIHDCMQDAQAAVRIFREIYVKQKVDDLDSKFSWTAVEDGVIDPLPNKKPRFNLGNFLDCPENSTEIFEAQGFKFRIG